MTIDPQVAFVDIFLRDRSQVLVAGILEDAVIHLFPTDLVVEILDLVFNFSHHIPLRAVSWLKGI